MSATSHRSAVALLVLFSTLTLLSVGVFGQRRGKAKRAKIVKEQKPTGSTSTQKCSLESELTEAERDAILTAHNEARKTLNLPALKWDCGLASFAQAWANAGRFRHRDDPSVGENLFVSTNSEEPIASVVPDWLDEKVNYVVRTGECKPDTVCTHYSQVMWRETTLVGCGINRKLAGKWSVLVVCNYSPAGNTGGPAY
ncbi:MAG: hypothetical protein KF756_11945 [Acidobacteria bacterium]|nr:hypothetical protein [Acidobacteriota bacterium]